jgi:hypothetical protein
MAIDDCQYTFAQLTATVLPQHMANLRHRMLHPRLVSHFAIKGVGAVTLARQYELKSDFAGCYVLIDGIRPIYVGISQTVLQRLRQHVRGTTHYDASLAYRIATKRKPHNTTRSNAMTNKDFKAAFLEAQKYLRGLNVAFIEIANPLERHLFEAFCAMELDTREWNTFETH